MIRDISRFLERNGAPSAGEEWWKLYFLSWFSGQEMVEGPDGKSFLMPTKRRTRDLGKSEECPEFIEALLHYGDSIGVSWSRKEDDHTSHHQNKSDQPQNCVH
jgi:hypothetical protein